MSVSTPPRGTTKKRRPCSSTWDFPFGPEGEDRGKKGPRLESAAEAEVSGPRVSPVPALRPTARLSPAIWHVPNLLPHVGPPGGDSWCDQGELVATGFIVHGSEFRMDDTGFMVQSLGSGWGLSMNPEPSTLNARFSC